MSSATAEGREADRETDDWRWSQTANGNAEGVALALVPSARASAPRAALTQAWRDPAEAPRPSA